MACTNVMMSMLLIAAAQPAPVQGAQPTVPPLPREGPVTKVVNLLRKMENQLIEEKETDEAVYEKLSCWCTSNRESKTKSIKDGEMHITTLVSDIEGLSAKKGRLTAELADLKQEVEDQREALKQATAMREKDNKEFTDEEAELVGCIDSLTRAISAISAQNGGQEQAEAALLSAKAVMLKYPKHGMAMSLLQQPANFNSYNSRSGEIFGILNQMKETFNQNLASSRADEAKDVKAYTELKEAKEVQIAKAREQIVTKTTKLSETEIELVNAKHDLKNTRKQVAADQKFLVDLEERCALSDKEWDARQKSRAEEIVAVGKAISILTDDSARDLFSNTYSFIQLASTEDMTRNKVAGLLKKAGQENKAKELVALASRVQLDAFTKVKAAIDDMLADLKKEQQDEYEHRDWCEAELRTNKKQTIAKTNEKDDLDAKIATLKDTVETLTDDIATLQQEIAELKVQLKRESEDRETQNKEFQAVVADQRASVVILDKALQQLRQVYEPKQVAEESAAQAEAEKAAEAAAPVLLQRQAPPKGFDTYSQNGNSGGVVELIRMTIADAERMTEQAIHDEQESQDAYGKLVADTNAELNTRQSSVVEKNEEKGAAEVSLSNAEDELSMAMTDLEKLARYASEVHNACDFVLKNYDLRQEARRSEMDALEQAKAILSGSTFA